MQLGTLCGRAVATLGLLAGLALAGPAAAAPSGTVTFAIPSEPPTVDPAIEVAGPGSRVLLQLYEGLLEYRGNTTELAPALAQLWRLAPDGTWIELKLRPNVKFHDGSLLDAETVKQSIERTKAMSRGGAFFLQALKEVQVVDRM
ncbi:MAG: ABC transporter substrate-binding protein, partial [Candidatus Rokuibacteriota bacterium]